MPYYHIKHWNNLNVIFFLLRSTAYFFFFLNMVSFHIVCLFGILIVMSVTICHIVWWACVMSFASCLSKVHHPICEKKEKNSLGKKRGQINDCIKTASKRSPLNNNFKQTNWISQNDTWQRDFSFKKKPVKTVQDCPCFYRVRYLNGNG